MKKRNWLLRSLRKKKTKGKPAKAKKLLIIDED
jgi:predicted transcriptional regulator